MRQFGTDLHTALSGMPDTKTFGRSLHSGDIKTCQKPSKGWFCTREAGHEGPCAAHQIWDRSNEVDA